MHRFNTSEMVNKNRIPVLRFKGFGESWIQKLLGEVCEKIQDGNYGAEYPTSDEFVSSGIPFLTSKALGGDGFLKVDKIDFIPIEKHSKLKKAQLKLWDVLFTNRGSNVGSIGFVDERIAHGNIGPQLTLLRCDLKTVSPKFLYQVMLSSPLQKQVRAQDSGSAMNFFGIGITSKFRLSIPTLPEQQNIASFLSAVDEKIQQLTRKKGLLEQYKKGVMQQLFSGKVRFKDENGKSYPKWEEKRLGDVCECLDNLRKPLNDSQRQAMRGAIPYWGANKIMDYVNDYLFDETLVLLAEDGGNFNEYETRPIANLSRGKCWVNNHTHVLKGKKNLSNEFLFYSLVHKNITGFVSGGTRAKLNKSEMLKISIGYPSFEEQQKIASFLSSFDTKIEGVATQIAQSQAFKKGLLQEMFV